MTVTNLKRACAAAFFLLVFNSTLLAQVPMSGDLVFGVDSTTGTETLELVRGPAVMDGGMSVGTFWDNTRVSSVEFDNFGGTLHNANGNLLAVDFGPDATVGGSIYSFSTTNAAVPNGTLIGNTTGTGGMGLGFSTRLGSLVVSPDNTKVAVQGYDPGSVIVYDYTPGDTMGAGAALSGARDTAPFLTPTDTQGLAWIDDNTIAAYDSQGSMWTVNATTMATTFEAFIDTMPIGSDYSSLLYNPEISPMLFAGYSGFADGTSESRLLVIDPSDFSLQHTVDLSTSGESMREMAFDADGNLYYTTFGTDIEVIVGAAASPTTIADNSGLDWYDSPTFDAFPGIDIGLGGAQVCIDGDLDCDGLVGAGDLDLVLNSWGQPSGSIPANWINDLPTGATVGASELDNVLMNWGAMAPAPVPEPSGLLCGLVGLCLLALRRSK